MRILHLEDSAADAELTRETLLQEWPACHIDLVGSRADYIAALKGHTYDLVLSDFSVGGFGGLEGLELARKYQPEIPFVFFSGTIPEEMAIDAMRRGAADYVLKDRPMRFVTAVREALGKQRDLERQRAAERRIREQNELLDCAREAIIVLDLQDRVLSWNQGASRLLGWRAHEVVGKPVKRFLAEGALTPLAGTADGADEWQGEVITTDKHGRSVTLDTHVTVVRNDKGEPRGRVCIGTDITEKAQLKEQFIRAQRLESLGMLAAGIAHDFNNILAPILLAPQLLRVRAVHPNDLRVLDVLEKSAERGAELVRQIVGFAQGAGGLKQTLQLRHLLRDIAAFVRLTFPKAITLETDIAADLWTVVASPSRIHQVLLNLCINARDAMPGGGVLRLRAENTVQAGEDGRKGRWVTLRVEDTGSGIPADIRERVWDPFFTTKTPDKGTGLGLSTVRGIIEDHGGFIAFETAEGQGTVFRIHLPAAGTNGTAKTAGSGGGGR
ncbi:MAG TPA: ATP-binding protein [Opitutaceae bacterium]|nr:ATP-binding protein [Opitutaceae bacterium]